MIEDGSGDLFAARVDALVNAVNTVGVMGKGLALAFKKKFPDNFTAYRNACESGELKPGKVFLFDRGDRSPRWVVNFPTKRHWRDASRIDDIRDGLVDLVKQVEARGIESLAMPALGCGLGGLEWKDVRPLIVAAGERVPSVRFVVFAPQ
ncbi:MAG: macro domain-containing protein [Myxococcota bacterium]|nr:macro domain-containing protein [Myxococcota bacterium]